MRYLTPPICDICGKVRGNGNDHSRCSKIRKANGKPNKAKATKTLNKKQINYLSKS